MLRVQVIGGVQTRAKFMRFGARTEAELNTTLLKAAEPMAREAAAEASRWGAPVAAGMAAELVGHHSVAVRQRNPAVTGLRPDFGSLQMREAILPSVRRNEEELKHKVELMLERNAHGF